MKRQFLLLMLFACVYSAMADTVITDGVYTISNRDLEGYLGLGAYHGADPYIYYVTDGLKPTADAYWTVTNTNTGYTFRNKATGQWLIYTTERVDQYYKWMTLADEEPDDNSQYWNIVDAGDGSVCVQSAVAEDYYWNLRSGSGMLGTYTPFSYDWNECFIFNLQDPDAPEIPDDPDNPDEPEVMTSFPKALHVFLNDGRIEAYPLEYVTNHSETGGQLVITTNIGQTFSYRLSDIDHVSEETPTDFPTFVSFKFNNKFNDQLFTDALGEMVEDTVYVTLAAIGKRLTPSFKLPDDETLVYVDGELQDSKVTRRRFDRDTYYVVTKPGITMLLPESANADTRGETTYSMQPYGRMVRVHVDWLTDRADVPRIYINTDDGEPIWSKTEYKDAEITIDGRNIFPSMNTTAVQIKGRGNSSWGWPKKPYRLKFDKKVKPLGMTNGKNWVLLSNYQTGSLMANAIGMKAANLMGAAAANHIVPVDLYLNGEYQGSYNLTEKVGFSNNSVDLEDESAAALLELDSYYDEPEGQKFHSTPYNLPINVKEPDFSDEANPTSLTLEMVKNDFNSFMSTLYYGEDISRHVDIEPLARFLMVNELICNYELYHPKSTFCYRENFLSETSKYVFGPVWDLDWAFGYERYSNYFHGEANTNYWTDMPAFEVRDFVHDLRFNNSELNVVYQTLWEKFMEDDLKELMEYCQDYYDFAHNSFDHNRELWDDATDYRKQASMAANWLEERATKIYDDILAMSETNLLAVNYEYWFDGRLVNTETRKVSPGSALPLPGDSLVNDFISLQPLEELPQTVQESITIPYEVTWNGPFEFSKTLNNATWYNMTIRTYYHVSKQDWEPYYPYIATEEELKAPEFQWAFGGDPYHLVVYNRTTGFDETLTQVDDYGLMRKGTYYWDVLPHSDGFLLRIKRTPSSCLNQYGGEGGPLQFWTDEGSLTDDGSTFRVEKVKDEATPVNMLADDLTKSSGNIYDIAGRRITKVTKPGLYIQKGKVVMK